MLDGRHAAATRGELGHGMGDGPTTFPYWLRPVPWMAGAWPSSPENGMTLHDGNAQRRGTSGDVGLHYRASCGTGRRKGERMTGGGHV
jgi:hypothetical protein